MAKDILQYWSLNGSPERNDRIANSARESLSEHAGGADVRDAQVDVDIHGVDVGAADQHSANILWRKIFPVLFSKD